MPCKKVFQKRAMRELKHVWPDFTHHPRASGDEINERSRNLYRLWPFQIPSFKEAPQCGNQPFSGDAVLRLGRSKDFASQIRKHVKEIKIRRYVDENVSPLIPFFEH